LFNKGSCGKPQSITGKLILLVPWYGKAKRYWAFLTSSPEQHVRLLAATLLLASRNKTKTASSAAEKEHGRVKRGFE